MAHRDPKLGQIRDLPLIQNQHLGKHDQSPANEGSCNLVLQQSYEHVLGQAAVLDLGLGIDCDRKLLLDHELALSRQGQNHGNEHVNEIANATGYDDENENEMEDNKPIVEPDDTCVGHHEHKLDNYAENNEFGLSLNHSLTIVENHEVGKNLGRVLHQNDDTGIVASSGMFDNQPEFLETTPALPNRMLVPDPNYELAVGQQFPDVWICCRAVRETAIALRFEIEMIKSDKTRFTAKCVNEGCPWRIHASQLPDVPTFEIRTIHSEHTCGGITHLGHHEASVQWVADAVEQLFKENPNCKPKDVLDEINRVHGITLTYKQAWRGKERIMATPPESYEEDYGLISQYCDQIRRSNPGSIASVYVNPADNCFQSLFVSFQASIFGVFNACRPLIGLDCIVLKSKDISTLLVATSFDGNGEPFPLAFGVVEEQNDDNWMWFLSELHNLMETNTDSMPKVTILSDMQRGIVDGVNYYFPTAFHGFCMHCLEESFKLKFDDSLLATLFREAASALTILKYEMKILEIENISQDAAYWIRKVPPQLWATAYFKGSRFGQLTASIGELLKYWILEASQFPIIQMMECIHRKLMAWFNERREVSREWTSILVPSVEKLVTESVKRARTCQVVRVTEGEFQVVSYEGSYNVDIRKRCCPCLGWQLQGFPCSHAAAALLFRRQNVYRFTEGCFTVATYRKAYSETINPVPDKRHWMQWPDGFQGSEVSALGFAIKPPKAVSPHDQPRKRRYPRDDEGCLKRHVHCSHCNQTGHF